MRKRAPGPGKQPKTFTENQGVEHLLELSQKAVTKTDAEYQHRVDRSHAAKELRTEAKKERLKKKNEAKQSRNKPTRAAMVALLREKRREKSRTRKLQRKQREEAEAPQPSGPRSILKMPASRTTAPKKRVSFH